MCGICGIASTRGTVDPGRLAAMSATLVQRGPDSDGAYLDGRVGLAARRLAIIDLATGDQPISNEDGRITVVQNGELYNYRELRLELERAGHRFSTSGDTEVLVHLYEEHGERFAERLRGMFAVALWDAERGRLVLARDPYGIKPLYYRDVGGEIEFASELRALPRGEIDLDALDAFLAFNSVPGPLTIFREVRKLQAGTRADVGERAERDRALRAARSGSRGRGSRRRRGRARRGAARATARLGARASRVRRAGRRAPLGRDRLVRARRARRRGGLGAAADVLDRLRGAQLRRARRRAARRGALRDAAPRARAPAGRGAAPAGSGRRVRRAVRRLLGAARRTSSRSSPRRT